MGGLHWSFSAAAMWAAQLHGHVAGLEGVVDELRHSQEELRQGQLRLLEATSQG